MRHKTSTLAGLALGILVLPVGWVHTQAPNDAENRFNIGLNHLREGRTDLAIEEFKNAIKQDPKNPYFYKGLGLAYARQNKHREAIECFRKALQLNPYYVDVKNDLGTSLVLSGKRDEGRKAFLEAFNDPTNPTPETSARNLGQSYVEEKRYAEAENWYRTSLQRNKGYPDAYLGLADVLAAQGKLDEATTNLELGVKSIPDNPGLAEALGEAYYRAGRFSDARTRLEQVAAKDPGGPAGRRAVELLKAFPK